MIWRLRWLSAVILLLVGTACSRTEPPEYSLVLSQIPEGFTPGRVLVFPDDSPMPPDIESPALTLYRISRPTTLNGVDLPPGIVGIFSYKIPQEYNRESEFLDSVGPSGLQGYLQEEGNEYYSLVAGWNLSEHQLSGIASNIQSFTEAPETNTIAEIEQSPVPPMGSVVIAPRRPGFAMSYLAVVREEPQRLVSITSFGGDDSTMQILRWWFGPTSSDLSFGEDGFSYREPARYVNDDQLVPGPVYEIWRDGGVITVVLTVIVEIARAEDGRPLLERPDAGAWSELEKFRPEGSVEAAADARETILL